VQKLREREKKKMSPVQRKKEKSDLVGARKVNMDRNMQREEKNFGDEP